MLQLAKPSTSLIRPRTDSTSQQPSIQPQVPHSLLPSDRSDTEHDLLQEAQSLLELGSSSDHLISSPYPDEANQLNLQTLDQPSKFLALALTAMSPIRGDYATASYLDSFNWTHVFQLLQALCRATAFEWREQEFYVVIFRSKLLLTANRDRLGELDQHSHREACESGGLLKYWFGSPDASRHNLATCLWRNREDAAAGGTGPWHKKARAAAKEMYENISFYTHRLVIADNVDSWRLEDYVHEERLRCPFHK